MVQATGFEPAKPKVPDLQSGAANRICLTCLKIKFSSTSPHRFHLGLELLFVINPLRLRVGYVFRADDRLTYTLVDCWEDVVFMSDALPSAHMTESGMVGGIRTPDPLVPNQMRYQTALLPYKKMAESEGFEPPVAFTQHLFSRQAP